MTVIGVIRIGHHGVQSVIPAGEFQNDENLAIGAGLVCDRLRRLGEAGGQESKASHPHPREAGLQQPAAAE